MHSVTVSRDYRHSADKVWGALDKFGNVSAYHPLVKESSIINGQDTGTGAERVCHFKDGNTILERIVEYTPNKNYSVEIYDLGSFPLKKAVALLEVNEKGSKSSSVNFKMDFQPKYGLIGTIMANMVMKKQFSKLLGQVLAGLDRYVDKQTLKKTA